MERTVKITLENAKEWYNSDNATLKELALQAFTRKELETISYKDILDKSKPYSKYDLEIPYSQVNKWTAIHKLAMIAAYLNRGWKPDWDNEDEPKWFILKNKENGIFIDDYYVNNYGTIYFKSKELALQAMEIMGDEINYIFD